MRCAYLRGKGERVAYHRPLGAARKVRGFVAVVGVRGHDIIEEIVITHFVLRHDGHVLLHLAEVAAPLLEGHSFHRRRSRRCSGFTANNLFGLEKRIIGIEELHRIFGRYLGNNKVAGRHSNFPVTFCLTYLHRKIACVRKVNAWLFGRVRHLDFKAGGYIGLSYFPFTFKSRLIEVRHFLYRRGIGLAGLHIRGNGAIVRSCFSDTIGVQRQFHTQGIAMTCLGGIQLA